ncbi:hypothetical protein PAMP_002405 [Pampus punctatissimus]
MSPEPVGLTWITDWARPLQQASRLSVYPSCTVSAPLSEKGWTRVSVPNPGWVSVITEPAPEKHRSPQGPVAHFNKEPKMLLAFAKLFFLSVPPSV